MKLRAFEYAVPLLKPLTTGSTNSLRKGFLISLTDEHGNTGWGEAAPLPGFSSETLEDVRNEIPNLQTVEWPSTFDTLPHIELPSLRFGVETAWLQMMDANWMGRPNPNAKAEVPCNGLISGPPHTWTDQLPRIVKSGMKTVKVKVGRYSLAEELDALDQLPNTFLWRLDANQSWSLDHFREVVERTRNLPIEYIEEPLSDPSDWSEALTFDTPLALDESLLQMTPNDLEHYTGLATIVLKPTLLGGISSCLEWAGKADSLNIACTLSGCFETGCGLRAIAALQSTLPGRLLAAGLDTMHWLGEDPCRPALQVENGHVEWGHPFTINVDTLVEVV